MQTTESTKTTSSRQWIFPTLGIIAAIAANTVANAGVFPGMGAFTLLPMVLIFWFVGRHSRKEMGFVWGSARYYGIGLLHPVIVLSLIALFAWAVGATNTASTDWSKAAQEFAVTTLLTIPVTLLTEDGFFRGWLWSSLKRTGLHKHGIVLVTGIAFGLWHLPYAILDAGYDLSTITLPMYIINASIIGIAWGLLRLMSGSVIVPAVVHGVWNGAAYAFFNNGAEIGALGIQNTAIFGPEAGLVGLALSIVYVAVLWMWYQRSNSIRTARLDLQPKPGLQSQDVT